MMKETSPLRILIVDDEPSAREIVHEMLAEAIKQGEVEIVGECEDGRSAIRAIRATKPDLVFLDVQMPEMDGFAVLSALPVDQLPLIIFVTAYDQYALRAFNVHALDYLLKPFDRERFDQAFERARHTLARERASEMNERILMLLEERGASHLQSTTQKVYLERLVVKTDGRVFFLRAEEIEWIEAEGNYVSLHVGKKAYLFREAISQLATQLDPSKFRRIHRSTIVNIDCIRELQPMFRGEYRVVMRDGTELKLSHNYRTNLQQQLGGAL
jgi:two-component system LytT family response regulator